MAWAFRDRFLERPSTWGISARRHRVGVGSYQPLLGTPSSIDGPSPCVSDRPLTYSSSEDAMLGLHDAVQVVGEPERWKWPAPASTAAPGWRLTIGSALAFDRNGGY